MQTKTFFGLFADTLKIVYSNPGIIFLSALFGIVSLGLSQLGRFIAPSLATTAANSVWLAGAFIVFIALGGFMSSGFSGMTCEARNGKTKVKDFIKSARKYWLKTGVIFVFFVVLYNVAINGPLFLFTKIMINARDIFTLSEQMFRGASFLIAFLFLIGIVIFFSLSHICFVVNEKSIWKSIKNSVHLVRKNYLATLSLLVVLFVLYRVLGMIPGMIGDLVLSIIFFPYAVVILTLFVKKIGK